MENSKFTIKLDELKDLKNQFGKHVRQLKNKIKEVHDKIHSSMSDSKYAIDSINYSNYHSTQLYNNKSGKKKNLHAHFIFND